MHWRSSTPSLQPKACTSQLHANTFRDGHEWHQAGSPSDTTWYTDGSLLQERAGTGLVNGKMRIKARTPGPQTIYRAEMCGMWIAATLAQPGDTIVLDNKVVTKANIHPAYLQSSNYDLHHPSYSRVTTKQFTMRRARGHRDPKKPPNPQDYQERLGNEIADEEAKVASTMHPGKGVGSTSSADIMLNKHVMPSPVHKWIVKARPQKLTPDAQWTSWLPLFAFNRYKWGPLLWGVNRWPGYGAPCRGMRPPAPDDGSPPDDWKYGNDGELWGIMGNYGGIRVEFGWSYGE